MIEDYGIRLVENIGQTLSTIHQMKHISLPQGLIVDGKIVDELGFYQLLKDHLKKLKLTHRQVRFYVPNPLIFMRPVTFPAHFNKQEAKDYIQMEFGTSIHIPYNDPIFDLYYFPDSQETKQEWQKATLFVAPKDEVMKYSYIFTDLSLQPIAADVQALGVYRYFHHVYEPKKDQTYLFVKFNTTYLYISIFHNHELEFLRYQNLTLPFHPYSNEEAVIEENLMGVLNDQILEIDRIMDFYQFSIQQGKKGIDEIYIFGDHPYLQTLYQEVENQFPQKVSMLKGYVSKEKDKVIGREFIPALGLALKGGSTHDS